MKTIYISLSILMMLVSTLNAQNVDLAVYKTNLQNLAAVKSGQYRSIGVFLKAHTNILAGEKMSISYQIDNGEVEKGSPEMSIPPLSKGEQSMPFAMDILIPEVDQDTISLNVILKAKNDTNPSNDTLSLKLVVMEVVPNDLRIELVSPSDRSIISFDSIVTFQVKVVNEGTNTLKKGDLMFGYARQGTEFILPPTPYGWEGNNLTPGDSAYENFEYKFNKVDAGSTVTVCYSSYKALLTDSAMITLEDNYNDNSSCINLDIRWPSSIEENHKTPIVAKFEGNMLSLINAKEIDIESFSVYNLNGHRVYETFENTLNHNIPNLKSGLYIVNTKFANGQILITKAYKE
ncbi:MAG: T9SS type A sorting domain-containing protein [Bacteroidia bacterium]